MPSLSASTTCAPPPAAKRRWRPSPTCSNAAKPCTRRERSNPIEHPARLYNTDPKWLRERVLGRLHARHAANDPSLSEAAERLAFAREHGCDSWDALLLHAARVAADPEREPFLLAFRALESAAAADLEELLLAHPTLPSSTGSNGNTLLNLAVNIGNQPAVEALLAAGAPANTPNHHGWTPLHAAAYANRSSLAALLLHHGAALDAEAYAPGGTPLIVALFWGHREVADLLAARQVTPANLRAAAGLGDLSRIDACFTPAGSLIPAAISARDFYRPHTGFPEWRPSPNPQEVLDEALVWACKANRVEALPRLLAAGARIDADPYRGTPLIWSAVCNRLEAASWLLAHGAPVNQKATFGGLTHGQGITALHLAAQYGHLEMARLLVAHGADPAIREDLRRVSPIDTANFFGQPAIRDFLRSLPS